MTKWDRFVVKSLFLIIPLAIAGALFETWFVLGAEHYEICKPDHGGSENQSYERSQLVGLEGTWVYVWHFLGCHHNSFIALFSLGLFGVTGWLAWVTRGLWHATVGLGDDARKNAVDHAAQMQASMKQTQLLESPFLIPQLVGMNQEVLPDGRTLPVAVYVLRNNGRSPAILRRFQDTMVILERLPDNYEDVWDAPLSSRQGQYIAIGPTHVQIHGPDGQHFNCALNLHHLGRTGRQYVIGRIHFQDLFGTSYVQGFCIQFLGVQPAEQGLVLHHVVTGDNVYNYRREEEPA